MHRHPFGVAVSAYTYGVALNPLFMLTTVFLAQLIGSFLVIFSLVMLTQGKHMRVLLMEVGSRPASVFFVGIGGLILSLIVVLTHSEWTGNLATVLITLIGWIGLIKSVLTIALPQKTVHTMIRRFAKPQVYMVGLIVCLMVGFYLAYVGFALL
jgi:hypothetical protein